MEVQDFKFGLIKMMVENDGVKFKRSWNIKFWCESAYGRHASVQTRKFSKSLNFFNIVWLHFELKWCCGSTLFTLFVMKKI
jgi:hypothetical protein